MLQLDLSVVPVLRTERLVLREVRATDAEDLHALRSDPEVMRYIGRPMSQDLEQTRALIASKEKDRAENNGITWAITRHAEDRLIGTIGYYRLKKEHFRGEVGYLLSPAFQGQGLMSEALIAVLDHGFQVFGFHTIEADTDPRNAASNRLLERHGFIREGLLKESFYWNGSFQDTAIWSLLRPRS